MTADQLSIPFFAEQAAVRTEILNAWVTVARWTKLAKMFAVACFNYSVECARALFRKSNAAIATSKNRRKKGSKAATDLDDCNV